MASDLRKREKLGEVGRAVLEALESPTDTADIEILALEAARIADRLDNLDQIISGDGKTWARITRGRDGTLEIRVDSALQEARQQAATLRQLVAEIRRQRGGPEPEGDDVLAGL